MIVSVLIMVIGLIYTIIAAQLFGLRLGGVIVIPLTAIYILYSFDTIFIFILSVVAAYISLFIVKRWWLVYGRTLFIISILTGLFVPILTMEFLIFGFDLYSEITGIMFVGSILPGIAAYNYHRLIYEKRILDILYSIAILGFLVVSGTGLVIILGNTDIGQLYRPILLSPQSDIANFLGIIVDTDPKPIIAPKTIILGIITVGLIISEFIRSRYGLRIAGVIVVPLVVLASFHNTWMLILWFIASFVSYIFLQIFNWSTLIYGRVLLAMGIIFGLSITILLVTMLGLTGGILPFFIAIISGVTAYNFHILPQSVRKSNLVITLGALTVILFLSRLFIVPLQNGILYIVETQHIILGIFIFVVSCVELYRQEKELPNGDIDKFEIVSEIQDRPQKYQGFNK